MIFEIILIEIGKFATLQLIIDSNNLEFRIKSDDEALRAAYCQTLKEKLNEIEEKNNIEFNVTLSDENPFVGNTGKFQMIVPKKSNINQFPCAVGKIPLKRRMPEYQRVFGQ